MKLTDEAIMRIRQDVMRQRLDDYDEAIIDMDDVEGLLRTVDALKAENAKLKEVQDGCAE